MTVVILTSGTSFTIPADWSNTNQIECFGDGGAGGGGDGGSGSGGGGGGYASVSNTSGLSGSQTIAIGAGGTPSGSDDTGGSGTGTTFAATPICSAAGGTGGQATAGGSAVGTGGAGVTGTTKHTGGNGGSGTGFAASGGGGGGCAGPAGNGTVGAISTNPVAGAGGSGDAGSGGAGGAGGNSSNGTAGTANANGGGGGGGGGAGSNGAIGGLPGGGGGGGGSGPQGSGGAGAGGQIRITYTPLSQALTPWTDLPPLTRYRQLKGARDGDKFDFQGWQRTPLSADSTPFIWEHPTFVPPGKWPWHRYQSWQEAPLSANAPPLFGAIRTELPQRTWKSTKFEYVGWQRSPIPAEFLVPLPLYDVPRGRYNGSRYQDWSAHPIAFDVVLPPIQPWTDLPPRSWDRRMQFQGVQVSPPIEAILVPKPIYDVPIGRFNPVRYQDWQVTYQRHEYEVPLPSYDVPRGRVLHSYVGWSYITPPPAPEPPLVSSHFTELPPRGLLQTYAKHMSLFQGTAVAPAPGDVIPVVPHMWLPLLGVGNHGP